MAKLILGQFRRDHAREYTSDEGRIGPWRLNILGLTRLGTYARSADAGGEESIFAYDIGDVSGTMELAVIIKDVVVFLRQLLSRSLLHLPPNYV